MKQLSLCVRVRERTSPSGQTRCAHPSSPTLTIVSRRRWQPNTAALVTAVVTATALGAQAPTRRQPVTPELERSAFADGRARTLLERARTARLTRDSALRAYDAQSFIRMSVGLGLRRLGRDRLLFRTEQASHVLWSRESGLWVEPTGRRTGFPMGSGSIDLTAITPVPFFPGRESLWIPSSKMRVVQAEVDESEMLHPLATGAEAYYTYRTGDSVSIRLPDGRSIGLRELRITARKPEWRAFVGSFWFDVASGSLVRAAYRMAAEMDVWQSADEESKRERRHWEELARTDTSATGREARERVSRKGDDDAPPFWVRAMVGEMHATISAITVEYGLYEGRFWLPKRNVAEGQVDASFMRMPVKVEESFRYNSVNSDQPIPAQPVTVGDDTTWATGGSLTIGTDRERRQRMEDTSLAARIAREDSVIKHDTLLADSLRTAAAAKRATGDTLSAREMEAAANYRAARARQILRRREGCAHGDSTYYAGTTSRYGGALRMAIRMPCDTTRLANSPDLPGSIYGSGEEIFGTADRDELLKSLDFELQPGWSPQKPVLHTGLDLVRYNKIEGLSLGGSATSVFGKGYTARLVGRIGTADPVPNAELSLIRSNGRTELQATAYRRLAVANDDWGAPLSFGASLANALYARDEGFYYRSWGGELAGSRDIVFGAKSQWRLFAERQDSVGIEPNTQASLGNLLGNVRFGQNIAAVPLTALGARISVTRSFGGADPSSTRLDTRFRGEGAFTDRSDSLGNTGYGRVVVDATLARNVGRFGVALTGATGSSVGDLPVQRAFYIGGLHTVRGQFARPEGDGRVGDAFWLGRAELGLGRMLAARPTLFYDIGWAGARDDFAQPGRPMSGAGVGLSLLDGLFRFDVARGIWPEKRWRADFSVDARF